MIDRRKFLTGVAAIAAAPSMPVKVCSAVLEPHTWEGGAVTLEQTRDLLMPGIRQVVINFGECRWEEILREPDAT